MENIVMNLSGMYAEEGLAGTLGHVKELDLTGLEGTNCYCDDASAGEIRRRLEGLPTKSVHWIDTGDYHYISRFWLEKAAAENPGKPFALLLFDHHPDMQEPAFGQVISCGGWVRDAFTGLEELSQVLMIGINPDLELEILDFVFDGVLAVTSEDLRHTGDALSQDVTEMISLLDPSIPVYVSIDLDVLTKDYARTDWDQGSMTLTQMESVLKSVARKHEILGMDICGGLTRKKGASDDDLELNLKTGIALSSVIENIICG